MNTITITTTNSETITSMEVAQMINKEHRFLLRDIHRYINQINKINESKLGESKIALTDFFIESTYITLQNKTQPCYNITHKGCEFIANKLTGIKGTEFTARYVTRFHELEEGNMANILISTMKNISDTMLEIQKSTNERLDRLENSLKQQSTPKKFPDKKYSRWKTTTFDKLRLLTDYVNEHSDQELRLSNTMHIILNEVQDTYNIEFSDYLKDYMFETGCEDRPYDLDVVNYYKDIRNMYDTTLNSILEKFNLELPKTNRNIFDELADKIAS